MSEITIWFYTDKNDCVGCVSIKKILRFMDKLGLDWNTVQCCNAEAFKGRLVPED